MTRLLDSVNTFLPLSCLTAIAVLLGTALVLVVSPPHDFPKGQVVVIPYGATLSEVAREFDSLQLVRFSTVLKSVILLLGASETIQAGDYMFAEPVGVITLGQRIVRGDFGLDYIKVRLPEGATRYVMADILTAALPHFEREQFLEITEGYEGFLFPDTYFFSPSVTTEDVMNALRETFVERTRPLRDEVAVSGHSFSEIVTMASLVEREAHDPRDRRLISGVLWRRIAIDMPLQVDAPFVALFGKASHELTQDDLATTSPYNTYVHKGLPPEPIGSPGLDAIHAALDPTESDYLYYLSDTKGVTYYAVTFEEHKRNREMYLN
ncbi:endolytic transglycosylase MltG [Candidatus Wolfebacteria bacterium]|nr:endolytic transglycosylase MltG [Candidatus Wolfebacteria bacterium]